MGVKQKFSERMGLKEIRSKIQLNDMDQSLRTAIWNVLYQTFLESSSSIDYIDDDCKLGKTLRKVWEDFLEYPVDEFEDDFYEWCSLLKEYINKCKWFEVYDLLEAFVELWGDRLQVDNNIIPKINNKLEQYCSGYRIIEHKISAITDENEIREIETAIKSSIPFEIVGIQLKESLMKLSDRESPDFRGSIKESISAVETLCRIITKDENIELGKALKFIETKTNIELHPALREAFKKLYGWTSDDQGIRHALMDYPTLGFPEAKFMLVACSAFINLLKEKAK